MEKEKELFTPDYTIEGVCSIPKFFTKTGKEVPISKIKGFKRKNDSMYFETALSSQNILK